MAAAAQNMMSINAFSKPEFLNTRESWAAAHFGYSAEQQYAPMPSYPRV